MAWIRRIPTQRTGSDGPQRRAHGTTTHVAALAAGGGEAFPSRRQEWNPPTRNRRRDENGRASAHAESVALFLSVDKRVNERSKVATTFLADPQSHERQQVESQIAFQIADWGKQ
jgi:hypothetical protein